MTRTCPNLEKNIIESKRFNSLDPRFAKNKCKESTSKKKQLMLAKKLDTSIKSLQGRGFSSKNSKNQISITLDFTDFC